MRIDVITLFPEMFAPFLRLGVCGRAVAAGKVSVCFWNPRDYAPLPHRAVDDKPYGGGSGMVLTPPPLAAAMRAAAAANPKGRAILPTPRGKRFNDATARRLAVADGLIFLCGRYRGIDERAVRLFDGEEISVGDYVLSGGETAVLTMLDTLLRFVPGVLGNDDSVQEEAFADGLLDSPCYTRPRVFEGEAVPQVLLCGDHAAIVRWRRQQAQQLTASRRPDLPARRDDEGGV